MKHTENHDKSESDETLLTVSARAWEHGDARLSPFQQFRKDHPGFWGLSVGFVTTLLFGLLMLLADSLNGSGSSAFITQFNAFYDTLVPIAVMGLLFAVVYFNFIEPFTNGNSFDDFTFGIAGGLCIGVFLGFGMVKGIDERVAKLVPVLVAPEPEPEPEPAWWEVWK